MENQRIFLAIFLSLLILLGYQYFFVPTPPPAPEIQEVVSPEEKTAQNGSAEQVPVVDAASLLAAGANTPQGRTGRDIPVETSLYRAVISEASGVLKSFQLKKYRETIDKDSGDKELVQTTMAEGLPLDFSWGIEPAKAPVVVYEADREAVQLARDGNGSLTMSGTLASGLKITRVLSFSDQDYLIHLAVDIENTTTTPLQGAPYLAFVNRPFSGGVDSNYVFSGPAVLINDLLEEVKVDDLKKGSKSFTGQVGWAAYEDSYFLCAVVPEGADQQTAHFSVRGEDMIASVLAGKQDLIQPGQRQQYRYTVYCGPKKLDTLKAAGYNLDRVVNFGWFDVVAKPTLYLMKFLYRYVGNYGVAIILVTVLIKLVFWPITQKGMKSMKTMQKLQPKMAKMREKYKDDKARQQQEMIKLYQTYKVNPLGGCLPMVIQIPVFFALYKVLLQTIELRHAPFMLWINDLSAPDRLFIGIDIPMLGGIPVLTLLMGASMFLQQKMTPSTGDPTQQKIMMFLPIVFTFMFLNFASGLVLYWFVNNLLSIGQQYMINRQVEA